MSDGLSKRYVIREYNLTTERWELHLGFHTKSKAIEEYTFYCELHPKVSRRLLDTKFSEVIAEHLA